MEEPGAEHKVPFPCCAALSRLLHQLPPLPLPLESARIRLPVTSRPAPFEISCGLTGSENGMSASSSPSCPSALSPFSFKGRVKLLQPGEAPGPKWGAGTLLGVRRGAGDGRLPRRRTGDPTPQGAIPLLALLLRGAILLPALLRRGLLTPAVPREVAWGRAQRGYGPRRAVRATLSPG